MNEATRERLDRGAPQGGVISPLLANIYLHYVLDLWAHQWRERKAKGDVIMVRYADDCVLGFQHQAEAKRFLRDMQQRPPTIWTVAASEENATDSLWSLRPS